MASSSASARPPGLDAEQHEVGGAEIAPAHLDAEPVDPTGRVPEPRGVDQPYGPSHEVGMRLDCIAGRTRQLGDQRAIGAQQRVEERRLARVRPPGQHQQRPLPEPLGRGRGGEQPPDPGGHGLELRGDSTSRHGAVVLLWKIDRVGQQAFRLDQRPPQLPHAAREAAVELAQGRPGLRGRAGVDEIADGLGLHQVELAVQHRAAGELTRGGGPRAGRVQRRQQTAGREQPPVTRELDEVLAGIAVGTGEDGVEAAVDRLAVGTAEGGEGDPPWRIGPGNRR